MCFQPISPPSAPTPAAGINAPTLRKRIRLWVNAGAIVESQDKSRGALFSVADAFPRGEVDEDGMVIGGGGAGGGGGVGGLDEERESAVASAEEQEAAGMRVYQQYVVGMLTNFDSLPLERIHNMLKMFVSDPPYDKSLAQLEAFLGRLVAEETLTVDRNVFSRKKS